MRAKVEVEAKGIVRERGTLWEPKNRMRANKLFETKRSLRICHERMGSWRRNPECERNKRWSRA